MVNRPMMKESDATVSSCSVRCIAGCLAFPASHFLALQHQILHSLVRSDVHAAQTYPLYIYNLKWGERPIFSFS